MLLFPIQERGDRNVDTTLRPQEVAHRARAGLPCSPSRARLFELGYSSSAAKKHVHLLRHLSKWLKREGILVEELTAAKTEAFFYRRRAQGKANLRTPRSLDPLLGYLRQEGYTEQVARDHGVSKTWLYELLARYKEHGEAGLVARSRRPHTSPQKISAYFEDEIVRVRKELTDFGFEAGAETIRVHLQRAHRRARLPSTSTIWRVLKARGFVVPEPHKRPKSSYVRFCAELPNETWQMDVTHVVIAGGVEVEVLNVIDDHSRLCVASVARRITKAPDVVDTFYEAAGRYGFPQSVLSDIQWRDIHRRVPPRCLCLGD